MAPPFCARSRPDACVPRWCGAQQRIQTMATKKKGGAKSKAAKTNEPQDEYTAQPATATDAGEPPEVKTGPTLADACASYIAGLDADGAGDGTLSSYQGELRMAQKHL